MKREDLIRLIVFALDELDDRKLSSVYALIRGLRKRMEIERQMKENPTSNAER